MAYGLPSRGQSDWDDELNNSIEALRGDVQSTVAQAAVAASDAAYARNRADEVHTAVIGTADAATAGFVNDNASETAQALKATYAAKAGDTYTGTHDFSGATVLGVGGGAAASDFAPFAWDFMRALEDNQQNLVLAFSGDSTMVSTTNWPYYLTQELASAYPTHTFVYKSKTPSVDSYEADVTVQTGSGTRTVTVYNWSQSGIGTGAGMLTDADLHIAFPVKPDLLMIGTGQNDVAMMGTDANKSIHRRQVRDALALFVQHYPQTSVGFVLPNPRTAADANYDEVLAANRVHAEVAAEMGIGVLDLTREWLTRPGGYADLMGDSVHPNVAGGQFSAGVVHDKMTAALAGPVVPTGPQLARTDEIWVPSQGSYAAVGTPVAALQATYSNGFGFAFDDTSDETIILPMVHIPWWWERIRCDLLWCPQTGNTGVARWAVQYARGSALPGVLDTMSLSSFAEVDATISTNQLGRTQLTQVQGDSPAHTPASNAHLNNELGAPYWPMQFRVTRKASHANDTLTGDALVYAIRLRRG